MAHKINLNTASRDELVAVPGIGAAGADAILTYRRRHGRFKSVNDLVHVAGIGGATLESVRGHLTASAAEGERGGAATGQGGEKPTEAARRAGEANVEAFKRASETGVETARQTGREATAAAREVAERGGELSRRAGEAAAINAEPFLTLGREGMEGLTRASQAVLDGAAELGHVWTGFWSEQLADGMDALRALGRCRTWREAVEIRNGFTRTSLARACAQAVKSTELTAGMITGGFPPLQESARKTAERAPRRPA